MRHPAVLFSLITTLRLVASQEASSMNWARSTCPSKLTYFQQPNPKCTSILDDETGGPSWDPWSQKPYCVSASATIIMGSNVDEDFDEIPIDDDEEFGNLRSPRVCVFTNSYFGNHGISVLAEPEIAALIGTKIQESYYSGFPSADTVYKLNLEPPAYKIVDMPEKGGKGIVATRHIARADTFIVDYTTIAADALIWAGKVTEARGLELLRRAFDQLVDSESVLGLSRHRFAENDDVDELAAEVMATNSFMLERPWWKQKTLYPEISVSVMVYYTTKSCDGSHSRTMST